MRKILNIIRKILSIPKTIYVNFKLFPVKIAVHFPMYVHYKTKIGHIERNSVKLHKVKRGIVQIGFHGTEGIPCALNDSCYIEFRKGSEVSFLGTAMIARGGSIRVGGYLKIGDGFSCNVNTMISCNYHIEFGERCMLGWNVNVRDSDNHFVIEENVEKTFDSAEVIIGNHVWIASYADVLKGSIIPENSIVAYRALVTKPFNAKTGLMLAGCPAKIVKENISWRA